MPWTSDHTKWLVDTGTKISISDGRSVPVLEFRHQPDPVILKRWAKHFRNHYCSDTEIDFMRKGYGISRREYLEQIKFPDPSVTPGPSIRSGDFAEVLAADYLQYLLGFWVPRTRYSDKTVRNESTKGCDIIGFKVVQEGMLSKDDTLFIMEAKALLTASKNHKRLQDAVDDSAKDQLRKAESLNAIKQRLSDKGKLNDAIRVERFQNLEDRPYKEVYGAIALLDSSAFNTPSIAITDASNHPKKNSLFLMVMHGKELMKLVHDLYRIAADEA